MIVLDASGSMTTVDAPGARIDAAKRAVTGMITSLPAGSQVGLLVYGTGTGSGDAERAAGCRDIKQLIPVGPVNKAAFIAAVQGVTAGGYTPMGAALEKAAAALPHTGPASIVLVSDGIDTCAPPSTCQVAKKLKAGDSDLVIHTIGFKVEAGARTDLSCVAQAAGGTYRDAKDGSSLTAVLQGQVDAGLRPYVVAGKPVRGTPIPVDAPLLDLGQYTDTLAAGAGATKYYSVRLARGETAYVAATVVPPALRGGGTDAKLSVVARLRDQQGHLCLSTQREHDTLLAGKVDPVTALVSGEVGGPKWSKQCPTDGEFVVAVTRDSASTVPTRSEIIVQVERPVGDPGAPIEDLPAGVPGPAVEKARTVTGGASFNDAPAIGNGTYRDTLSTGETRYYKVRLNWGQRLAYRVVVDKISGLGHGVGYASSAIASSLRQEVGLSYASDAAHGFGGPESVSLTGSTLVPVEYANRNSDQSGIRLYSLAGDYYLSVGMSYPVDAVPYRTGISISVQVVGTAQAGPTYQTPPSSGTPTRTSPESVPPKSVPQSSSVAATPMTTSATTASTPPAESATTAASPRTPSAGSAWWIWLIVAVVVVAGGAAVTAVIRRRPKAGH